MVEYELVNKGFSCEAVARAALGEPVKREGAELLYRCPHAERHKNGDAHPSLKINARKDAWSCFVCGEEGTAWALAAFLAGLDAADKPAVTAWLREHGLLPDRKRSKGKSERGLLTKRAAEKGEHGKPVATYTYCDAAGNAIARKLRFLPRDFTWEHLAPDGTWRSGRDDAATLLYRLELVPYTDEVWVVEGEKDADAIYEHGFIAVSPPDGAGHDKWHPEFSEPLRGKRVFVVADADETGRAFAQEVAAKLYGIASEIRVGEVPFGKDAAEFYERGGTDEQLLDAVKSWPVWRPATGAEILDSAMDFIRRFVSLTEPQARAIALWIVHTHAIGAADCTPYLNINSAEKQSGKTRLLEVFRLLVCKPWFTGRVTAAVLTRKVDAEAPTLLLDESDAAFNSGKEYAEAVRGLLNSGYQRGGRSSCCVKQGADIGYRDFSVFCPKAIAGIGKLPDTVTDRSIQIKLKRARRGTVDRFRERDAGREARELQGRMALWCSASLKKLRDARPATLLSLSDRKFEVCEPLLAVADLAGGEWPKAARKALVELCSGMQAEDDSTGAKLLRDIRSIFEEKQFDELASSELAAALAKIETSPWGEWSHGKPLSPAKLARLLKPFEIYPAQIQNGAARGYRLADFREAFALYLAPTPPLESVKVSESECLCGSNADFKVSNKTSYDTFKNAVSPSNDAGLRHFDTLKPGEGGHKNTKNGGSVTESVTSAENDENQKKPVLEYEF